MPDVRPGQIWADNNPRSTGRKVRVEYVDSRYAYVVVVDSRYQPWPSETRARHSRILLDRFRPTSTGYRTGYRLIAEAPQDTTEGSPK